MTAFERRQDHASGATAAGLHYYDVGKGPVLLLLHGFGPGIDSMSQFGQNLTAFSACFRVIAVDLPGFGGSDIHAGPDYYPEHTANALLSLMNMLGIRQAHLLGVSLGSWVATQLAVQAPERFLRLTLVSPGGLFADVVATSTSESLRRLVGFMNHPTTSGMLAWLETQVSHPNRVTEELVEASIDMAMTDGAIERLRKVMDNFLRHSEEKAIWAHTHKVKVPTLVVLGRDDRVLPVEGAFFGARRLLQGDIHIFSDCGHRVQMERGADFEDLVLRFFTG